MLLFTQTPHGTLSARRCPSGAASSSSSSSFSSALHPFSKLNSSLFSKPRRPRFPSRHPGRAPHLTLSNAGDGDASPSTIRPAPIAAATDETEIRSVADDGVPLEGVIQFEKPRTPSKFVTWAQVGLLAGGDVACLLIFSAVGRLSHGLPAESLETFKTADPFVAGWVLSAYFFGGYGDDGRGINGSSKSIVAAAKSWAVGIPLGLVIRGVTSGHIPPTTFMLVTMGSTGILLIAWRALISSLLGNKQSKKNDVYKRGSPFELFELLTSLIRRW